MTFFQNKLPGELKCDSEIVNGGEMNGSRTLQSWLQWEILGRDQEKPFSNSGSSCRGDVTATANRSL